ncbi:fructosamine kinase family protein [Cellulomonas sp. ES6]|uniref:fructosamine kinase family protein n=1 Tax=Cellulomonas sp. ES6 TaxID=3039384 RepID=UPI0024B6CC6F|nr:fructosamine kinase family protein [Cellulomonas sp. ES6]WHP18031.1 fructosamine kinase family protein [Cellulomonas sp. ES6]
METYRKQRAGAPAGFFACEAAGLRWLAVRGGAPVVPVLGVGADHLDLERLPEVAPSRRAARELGARLAVTHDAGAPRFGSPPPGWDRDGFFGPLDQPLPMPAGDHDRWGAFLADRRIEPMAELAARRRALPPADLEALARLAEVLRGGDLDDDEPPARLHGDLWSGNVLWTPVGATLIDPAAHGGHRETDLAMLALFGCPHLDELLDAYQEVHPLRRGWQRRVALHQVYPVGMHAVLFGGGYAAQLRRLVAPYV